REQPLGNGRAVERDERAGSTREWMDDLAHQQALARPRGSGHEHGHRRRRERRDLAPELSHRRTRAPEEAARALRRVALRQNTPKQPREALAAFLVLAGRIGERVRLQGDRLVFEGDLLVRGRQNHREVRPATAEPLEDEETLPVAALAAEPLARGVVAEGLLV